MFIELRVMVGGLAVLGAAGSAVAQEEAPPTQGQHETVRKLSWEHNARIQKILDTAPPTRTREAFTAQVYAIS